MKRALITGITGQDGSYLARNLIDNGYKPLQNWSGKGLGDTQLVLKNRSFDADGVAVATQAIVTAPSGRIDDPDNLLDKGFGDGQWDVAVGAAVEESLGQVLDRSVCQPICPILCF